MDTIKVKVNYNGRITVNSEYTTKGPIEVTWFPNTDLVIETEFEKIVVNTDKDETIVPEIASNDLEEIGDVGLKLCKNNISKYLIINDKYAYRLPSDIV